MSEQRDLYCARCSLLLVPGSSHTGAEACVDALRHALDEVSVCDGCGEDIGAHCFACTVKKHALRKAGEVGMGWFSRLQEGLSGGRKRKKGRDDE